MSRVYNQQVGVLVSAPENNDFGVLNQQISVLASSPPPDIPIYNFQVCVLVRADHKPNGGAYSVGATENSEDQIVIYHELVFPRCISYGSTSSPKYFTEKVEVDSGAEQRNQRREYPRHEYNIVLDNLPANEISEILNLWHVVKGSLIGFLFLDPLDHTSNNSEDSISGETVSDMDQLVASAVGTQDKYPLYKYYELGGREVRRRILYPDLDTLVVSVDGFRINSWSYSYSDKLLTFFKNVAIRTQSLSRDASGNITGDDFSALAVGDLIYMSGWSNGAYNALEGGDPARVTYADSTTLRVERYDGTPYGSAALGPSNVTYQSAFPPTGAEIRAGFYFYVPVRFENDDAMSSEIKSGARESAVVSFDNITLREIFE